MDPLAPRVAARFTARTAGVELDEKMKALLLKLRKGADSTLSQGILWKVLTLLGGWRIEQIIGLVPLHYEYEGKARKEGFAEADEATARAMYDKLKSEVVSHLPSSPEQDRQYVMDLEDLTSWEHQYVKGGRYHGTKYNAWIGAQGWRITDPKGATFEVLPSRHDLREGRGRDRKKLTIYDAVRWLKKDTTWLAQINDLLGMEEHVPAEQRSRDNTGTCAVCFRNIKLVQRGEGAIMALHGYNRPGHGFVVGRCWGGDHAPYELSCEATKLILKHVEEGVRDAQKYIASIPTLTEFNERRFWGGGAEPKIVKQETNPDHWPYMLKEHTKAAERDIGYKLAERDVLKWLVEHWEVRELPREGDKQIDWWTVAARAAHSAV